MYFESKAKDLLRKQDSDLFAKSSLNLLFFSSPNIDRKLIEDEVSLGSDQGKVKSPNHRDYEAEERQFEHEEYPSNIDKPCYAEDTSSPENMKNHQSAESSSPQEFESSEEKKEQDLDPLKIHY